MKSLLVTGGIFGLVFGVTFSLIQDESLLTSLWHGCLAAVLVSVLLPWWGRAWSRQLEEVAHEKQDPAPDSLLSTSTHPNTSKS